MSAPPPPRYLGAHVKRLEDSRLLAGQGRFLDDITLPGLLHAAFVRSTHAHAIVRAVDTEAARRAPGVVRVLTAQDVPGLNDAGEKHDEPLFPTEVMFYGHAVC